MSQSIRSFSDFWPFYVKAHAKRGTRVLHAIGSVLALCAVAAAALVNGWFLVAAPLIGYGFAWYGHFFVEGNKPATFGHPFYSLAADYRMLYLTLTGRMEREVELHAQPLSADTATTRGERI
jgi:hypothetical protein